MRETLREIFGDKMPARLLEEVTAYELDMEKRMLVRRELLFEFVKAQHAAGKTLVALSDIYLPSDHLRPLLEHVGLSPFFSETISSADRLEAKASGAGYRRLIEERKWNPATWMHIGDNPISDGLVPASLGIRSLVIRDSGERKRKAVTQRYWTSSLNRHFWRGRFVQQLMLPLEAENQPQSDVYRAGYTLFAPLLCGFIHHVALRTRELGIRRVYFLSREGYLFVRLWEKLRPFFLSDAEAPSAHYLHVSRAAVGAAACGARGLMEEMCTIAILPPRNRDFRDIARVYALDVEPLVPFLARNGLQPDTPISGHHAGYKTSHRIALTELLLDADFQAEVRRQKNSAQRALVRYLKAQSFFDQPDVAVVDVGWLGTIQRFLHDAVAQEERCPSLHGFLLAALWGYPFPQKPGNWLEGWFCDRNRMEIAPTYISYGMELFEEACRGPEPGLEAYVLDGENPSLRFRRVDDERAQREAAQSDFYEPLRRGVLDAAERYGAAMLLNGYEPEDLKAWLNHLVVARLAFPTAREVTSLRHQFHLNDLEGAHPLPFHLKKQLRRLWDASPSALRFEPLLRTRFARRHLRDVLMRS